MIRKVYEVNPFVCPDCSGTMKIIAFLTDYAVVDRIIDHPKLMFVAEDLHREVLADPPVENQLLSHLDVVLCADVDERPLIASDLREVVLQISQVALGPGWMLNQSDKAST